jgi:sortase (surface protein transpeptidase)
MRAIIWSGGGRGALAVAVATTALLGTACGGEPPGPSPWSLSAAVTAAPVAGASAGPEQAADPVRIRIPAIGVEAAVVALEVDAQGVLPPPATNGETGWWRAGPEPGEPGPAVVVGHVDSRQGPAVFFRLRQLVPGDEIAVDRADGSTAVFTVGRNERYGKHAFPTDAVYGDTPDAQLRLITCGGGFDRRAGSYLDNQVVFANRTA